MTDTESGVEFTVDADSDESEVSVSAREVSQAVVSSTDWTTQTILFQLEHGNIGLNPRFQRRDAWTRSRKSRFVESLMLGLPVPQIVLAERRDARGKYIVLDGKQRLLSLLQYTGKSEGKNNAFPLVDLEIRTELERKKYSDLTEDVLLREDLDSFHNQTIRSVVIRNWPNIDFLHTVFLRLNTGSVSLSPQELRQALFPGPFADYVDSAAAESRPLQRLLKIKEPDFRMRDVELLVRFLAFSFVLNDYAGSLKPFLDNACERFNSSWAENESKIKTQTTAFDDAVSAGEAIFGIEGVGRKWSDGAFQSRLNRAVLDVTTFYFSNAPIREAAIARRDAVCAAFKHLCESDDVFRTSIETTTKSLTATYERLRRWGEALDATLDIAIPLPEFDGLRIRVPGAVLLS
jgi:hypothetical protein